MTERPTYRPTPRELFERRIRQKLGTSDALARTIFELSQTERA